MTQSSTDSIKHLNSEILIVDDNPNNLRLLSDMLTYQGYEVRKAIDGNMALLSVQAELPDIVLLDIKMPQLNGYEVCKKLKADPRTCEIPVIFLSALDEVPDKIQAFRSGGVDYITKPFQFEEVLARVQSQLTIRKLTQTLEQQVEQRTADLDRALQKLQNTQLQLVQSEKMATLGQLVAGVAHEINNPINFLEGNLELAQQGIQVLLKHLNLYQEKFKYAGQDIENHAEEVELDYLIEDLPAMLASMKIGTDRIRNLSISLRTFSRLDGNEKVSVDLHDGIDSTLVILQHRLKANKTRPTIQIVKKYGQLPFLECYPSQLNQVFMNILANSIDAFDEMTVFRSFAEIETNPNWIEIQTDISSDRTHVQIRIKDNGPGISEDICHKIFDYLFTTKEPGKGTGFGLSISRQIVVEKHKGTIRCFSEPGKGTEFTIDLPLLIS